MTDTQTTQGAFPMKEAGSMIGSDATDIKTAASQEFDQAVAGVRSKADEAKTDAASEVRDAADALRKALEGLRGGSAQDRTLGQVATSLADMSDSVRGKDLGQILQMASTVARAHPILFLGSAALLGFVVSRYAKASGDGAPHTSSQQTAEINTQIDAFVDDGNPNTQPAGPAA